MNHSSITVGTENRIATVTLHRPDARNALDDVMIREMTEAFSLLNRSPDNRVVVLTGSGNAFCAGMDIPYLQRYAQLSHSENLEDAKNLLKLLQTIHTMKKPVIAMVNGPAMGGGCGLAAACDFVYAAKERARLGVPEVRLGFLPALIVLFLIKRMGEGRAREFVLRGDVLTAPMAQSVGLVTEIVEDDRLEERVYEFAGQLAASTSGSSVALMKELFSRLQEMNEKDVLEYAANLNALTRKTDDFKKGIDSFIRKEKLQW